jgi:hypothetical protein
MKPYGQFGKAAFAFAVAFLGALAAIMVGSVGFEDISDGQWVAAVLAGLVAGGGVYGIPYVPSKS